MATSKNLEPPESLWYHSPDDILKESSKRILEDTINGIALGTFVIINAVGLCELLNQRYSAEISAIIEEVSPVMVPVAKTTVKVIAVIAEFVVDKCL